MKHEPGPSRDPGHELGTILGIWAHPDDEAYLSGGLMAAARDRGLRVVCVTATRGERGTADPREWPPERLAQQRTAELAESLAILGVTEHRWLEYPDGGCAEVPPADAIGRLRDVLDAVRPDTVLTFDPTGHTGHPDHRAVSAWATAAFERAAPPGARLLHAAVTPRWVRRWAPVHAEFGVFDPGLPVTVDEEQLAIHVELPAPAAARKVRALAAQVTQTTALIEAIGLEAFTAWVSDEAFVRHR